MKRLVYSYLVLDRLAEGDRRSLIRMYELWAGHLRGPGQYDGDIILFTDEVLPSREGVRILPMNEQASGAHIFYRRVLNYSQVPAKEYDVVLQTDLDVLAMHDIQPLFEAPAPFCAATSGLRLYDPSHVGNPRYFPRDFWRGFLPGQKNRPGVSACVFGCRSSQWESCMSAWRRLVVQNLAKPLPYRDQTVLNLAYARQSFPITPYPASFIRHKDWELHPDAILFHFPTTDRLSVMRRFSRME